MDELKTAIGWGLLLFSLSAGADYSFVPDDTYTNAEKEKALVATQKVNEVIQSACFEDFILYQRSKLLKTEGLNKQGVIYAVRSGGRVLPLTMYYKRGIVVGYHNPGSDTIHTNRYIHSQRGPCGIAANFLHEASHVLGFSHSFNPTPDRPYSVPYTMSAAMTACCKE